MTHDQEWHPAGLPVPKSAPVENLRGGFHEAPAYLDDGGPRDDFNPHDASFTPAGAGPQAWFDPTELDELDAMFAQDKAEMETAVANAEGVDFEDDDVPVTHAPNSSYRGYVAAQSQHEEPGPSWIVRHKRAIGAGALGALLLGGGGAAFTNLSGGGSSPTTLSQRSTTAVADLSRPVPNGWSNTPVWSQAASVISNVAVNSDTIAFLSASGSMEVRDKSGKQLLSSPPTMFTQGAVVGVTKLNDGSTAVVANQGTNTQVWVLSGSGHVQEGKTLSVPSGASVSWGSGALLVSNQSQAWSVGPDLKLKSLSIPSGFSAMGILADGRAVAGKPGSNWKLVPTSGGAQDVKTEKPSEATKSMNVAWTSNGVMVTWGETKDSSERVVGFYDVTSGKLLASGTMPTADVNKGLPLAVSGDRSRASAGGLLANLDNGTTQYVAGWDAISADRDSLYGSVNGVNKSWSGSGQPSDVVANTAIPWGALANGDVVVVDLNSTGQQFLAVLQRTGI